MRLLLLLTLCLSTAWSSAQGLTLKNLKKEKDIPLSSYLKIHVHPDGLAESSTEEHLDIYGVLSQVSGDSIVLLVDYYEKKVITKEDGEIETTHSFTVPVAKSISKANITGLQINNSKKKFKAKDGFQTFGGVLIVTGIATLANTPVIQKPNRKALVISGISQIVVGTLVATLIRSKTYKLKTSDGSSEWQIE